MEQKFFANLITCEKGCESYTVGFSDNGNEPDNYIIIEKALEFDAQDIDLGMNTYYFEYNGNSDYGICRKVVLKKTSILFLLNDNSIDDISEISVSFSEKSINNKEKFVEMLRNILGNILVIENG